jgi:hypothetical protein
MALPPDYKSCKNHRSKTAEVYGFGWGRKSNREGKRSREENGKGSEFFKTDEEDLGKEKQGEAKT